MYVLFVYTVVGVETDTFDKYVHSFEAYMYKHNHTTTIFVLVNIAFTLLESISK